MDITMKKDDAEIIFLIKKKNYFKLKDVKVWFVLTIKVLWFLNHNYYGKKHNYKIKVNNI